VYYILNALRCTRYIILRTAVWRMLQLFYFHILFF